MIVTYFHYDLLLYLSTFFSISPIILIKCYRGYFLTSLIDTKFEHFCSEKDKINYDFVQKDFKLNMSKVCILGLIQFLFDTTTIIFISLWSAMIQNPMMDYFKIRESEIPYGILFSILMISVMIGSQLYRVLISRMDDILSNAFIMFFACVALFLPALDRTVLLNLFNIKSWILLFISFNLFEICFGAYIACIGSIRSFLLPDNSRSLFMNIITIPSYISGSIILFRLIEWENTSTGFTWTTMNVLTACGFLLSTLLANL